MTKHTLTFGALLDRIATQLPDIVKWVGGASVPAWVPSESWMKLPTASRPHVAVLRSHSLLYKIGAEYSVRAVARDCLKSKAKHFSWGQTSLLHWDPWSSSNLSKVSIDVLLRHFPNGDAPAWDIDGLRKCNWPSIANEAGSIEERATAMLELASIYDQPHLFAQFDDSVFEKAFPQPRPAGRPRYDREIFFEPLTRHPDVSNIKPKEAKAIWIAAGIKPEDIPKSDTIRKIIKEYNEQMPIK